MVIDKHKGRQTRRQRECMASNPEIPSSSFFGKYTFLFFLLTPQKICPTFVLESLSINPSFF